MKLYYAHPISLYNTEQEKRDLLLLNKIFPQYSIYNPNNNEADVGYKQLGMKYFEDIIESCNLLVFRVFPLGKIPAGIAEEIKIADRNNISIIELPCFTNRFMSIEDTRSYLKECGFR